MSTFRRAVRIFLGLAGLWFAQPWFAKAQEITRSELGVGVYAQLNAPYDGNIGGYRPDQWLAGPFARYTFNVNRSLALETSVSDSANTVAQGAKIGGHQLLMLGGIKAGVRRRTFGVFGRLDAGANSFTHGDEVLSQPPRFYRETHFALQPGLSLEKYVTPRTILRLDVDESLNAIFSTVRPLSTSLFEIYAGQVPNHLGLGISVERRFGRFEDAPNFTGHPESFTLGGFFPLQIRQHEESLAAPALGGGGIWIGVPASRFLSFDLIAFDIPHDDYTAGPQDGGTSFSANAGPKVGIHIGRLGLFAKARPGITRFSRTSSSLAITSNFQIIRVFHPQIDFSLDTGGVFEYGMTKHVLLRFEAGNDSTFLKEHTMTYQSPNGSATGVTPSHWSNSIVFLGGMGWRF